VKTADGGRDTTSLPTRQSATILQHAAGQRRLHILPDQNVQLDGPRRLPTLHTSLAAAKSPEVVPGRVPLCKTSTNVVIRGLVGT